MSIYLQILALQSLRDLRVRITTIITDPPGARVPGLQPLVRADGGCGEARRVAPPGCRTFQQSLL